MKKVLLVLLMCSFCAKMLAQLPTDLRSEQVFIRPFSYSCVSGDSIYVEGMVTCLANDHARPYSRYVYVEMINEIDSVVSRQKVACGDDGYFSTRIQSDPYSSPGVCHIRAYTNLMRNFSEESFAIQPLLVNQKFSKHGKVLMDDVNCVAIPSGGVLVPSNSLMQSVAVLLTDNNGYPLSGIPVDLVDSRGTVVYSSNTTHSGQALLWTMPNAGETYSVSCTVSGEHKSFPLPPVSTSAVKLMGKMVKNTLKYEILNASSIHGYSLYTYDRENGLCKTDLLGSKGRMTLKSAPDLLTLFLVDSDNNVVSEFTTFAVDRNTVNMVCKDTVKVGERIDIGFENMNIDSCHVLSCLVPYDTPWMSHAESALLYESDYRSPLPFPYSYYEESVSERALDMLAWLSTISFKRFAVKDVVARMDSTYRYMPETVMSFSGKVDDEWRYSMKKGAVIAYNMVNNMVYEASLDSNGRFIVGVDDFADGDRFFLQYVNGKGKPENSTIKIDDSTYPAVLIPRRVKIGKSSFMPDAKVEVGIRANRYELPDVVVKARVKKENIVPTNKFYSINYADREKIEEHNYQTLEDILNAMPGVEVVVGMNGSKALFSTRGPSLLSGATSLPIMLDGVRIYNEQLDLVLSTPAFEIEEVELLRPWQTIQYLSGAIDGAVLVKTRGFKKVDTKKIRSIGTIYTPMGLSGDPTVSSQSIVANEKGKYRFVVDVVTDNGINSFEKTIVVE